MKIKNIQHNIIQWYHNTSGGLKLEKKKKNDEQLKHRNTVNEILWIYGMYLRDTE